MFKKILFPIDNSENSKKAQHYVVEMAKRLQSEVIIFHSYEFPTAVYGHPASIGIYYYNDELKKAITEKADKILNEIKSVFEAEKIAVKIITEKGEVGKTIIELIDLECCDLVIMASRGLNSLESFFLGSKSNYVLHHTKIPVMIIH